MTAAVKKDAYELTPTQEAMLLFALYAPKSAAYFEQFCYSYRGPLNVEAFKAAWQQVIDRHSILRTSFCWDDGPHQVQHGHAELPFAVYDWRALEKAEQETLLTDFLAADREQSFDLSQAPLIRIGLIQTGPDSFYIVISNHHLVLDGWSMGILRREVSENYQALICGQTLDLAAPAEFRDYVTWLKQAQPEDAESFWRNELGRFSAPTSLPIDNSPASLPGVDEEFDELTLKLPEGVSSELQASARRHRLTMSTIAQGAWALLLGRYCRSEEVMFGVTVSGRPYDFPEVDSLVGLLINTLPLRVHVSPTEPAAACFQQIQRHVSRLLEHETSSLKEIHKWSELAARNLPLFETLVVFENFAGHDSRFNLGGEVELSRSHLARTNYPLTLVIRPEAELGLHVIYHRSRFAAESIERLLNHFAAILESLANDLDQPLSNVRCLNDSERHTLLADWSGAGVVSPDLQPAHRLFELQAQRTPDSIAVEHEGQRLTYAELNARANQLAGFLRAQNVRCESLVGICLERSLDMIVAVLAVMKGGGAYVPLDPAYPKDRLAFMLEDSGAQFLLTRDDQREKLPPFRGQTIALDTDAEAIARHPADEIDAHATLQNLAYVIYTSGSTGAPKGVMVEHRALANFALSAAEAYEIGPADRMLQFASLCFDTSAEEIYCALTQGATLVLRTEAMLTSAQQFLRSCADLGITVLDLPTGYWHFLNTEMCRDSLPIPESIRLMILGGEQVNADQVARWSRHASKGVRLLNTYGPTEATVVTTAFDLSARAESEPIAIGRPLRGASVYVLDHAFEPVPIGLAGELCIGGAAVARGYLNRPELTAEKSIPNPFGAGRLYRSGDSVRYLSDGTLEFLGRVDNQVKIRGFRIEMEEVEQAIRAHPGVSDAVVTVHEDTDGDKRLCAYLVTNETDAAITSDLRGFLKRTLPAHMMPSTFTVLEMLPLMPNGKVDRQALPAPDSDRPEVDEHFIAPRTPIEEMLATIWGDALKLDRVGIHDNFFDLGGHSLLAARVFSELQKKFNTTLNLVDIFTAPTIAELAEMIYQRETSSEEGDELESLLSELDGLSDEEANRWLSEEAKPAPTLPL